MNRRIAVWGTAGTIAWAAAAGAATPTGQEIMERNEAAQKIASFRARAEIATETSPADRKVKRFEFSRKLAADQANYRGLVRFDAPAEIRGESILFVERGDGKNDVLMYLPAYKKVRRVESDAQSRSFMGSVFSYSDISTPHASEFKYRALRKETCPVSGKGTCFIVEGEPASDEVRARTGYGKVVHWVREDNFMAEQSKMAGVDGRDWKTMRSLSIQPAAGQPGKWMAHEIRMDDQRTLQSTVLKLEKVAVGVTLPDSLFTPQSLAGSD